MNFVYSAGARMRFHRVPIAPYPSRYCLVIGKCGVCTRSSFATSSPLLLTPPSFLRSRSQNSVNDMLNRKFPVFYGRSGGNNGGPWKFGGGQSSGLGKGAIKYDQWCVVRRKGQRSKIA